MATAYFQSLNYSMANEDTTLEFELARRLNSKAILSIGGSGSRCLPFLALPIDQLHIVDVSPQQILFIQFKLETIRQLTREDAITFWLSPESQVRQKILDSMKLTQELLAFYKAQDQHQPDHAPLFWGKWERTFQTFAKLTALFFSQTIREGLFQTQDSYNYFQQHIKGWRWNLLLKIVGNKAMFNSLLYKGDFIKKNSPLSYFEYYSQAFERLFALKVKQSHFLQLCLLGRVLPEGLPIEFSPQIFEQIKKSKVQPSYQQGSVFEGEHQASFDFISLSDVPSYLSGPMERDYLQVMGEKLRPSGVIVNRFYLRTPEGSVTSGLRDFSHEHRDLIAQELVQMYMVQLLQKRGP